MKILHHSNDRLVLGQYHSWVRGFGACVLAGALAIALLMPSGQRVECAARGERPACTVTERTLARVSSITRVAKQDVRRIEIATETGREEDSHCVTIQTASTAHQVGRCSAKREARLDEMVEKLRAFYAGKVPTLQSELSDAGIIGFLVTLATLFGLGFLAPGMARCELDRSKGELSLSSRTWLLGRATHTRVPLFQVREVTLDEGLGEDGDERTLVLHLADGRKLPLNDNTRRSLANERQAITEFLAASASAYR